MPTHLHSETPNPFLTQQDPNVLANMMTFANPSRNVTRTTTGAAQRACQDSCCARGLKLVMPRQAIPNVAPSFFCQPTRAVATQTAKSSNAANSTRLVSPSNPASNTDSDSNSASDSDSVSARSVRRFVTPVAPGAHFMSSASSGSSTSSNASPVSSNSDSANISIASSIQFSQPKRHNRAARTPLHLALTHATQVTQQRIAAIDQKLQQSTLSAHNELRLNARKERLQLRLRDFQALPSYLRHNQLEFQGFTGWDSSNKQPSESGASMSQFESVLVKNISGEQLEIPLESRINTFKGKEVDLINRPIAHNNHFHDQWQSGSLISALNASVKWQMGQDDEGCPCCMAGLDFDEFAAAMKEVSKPNMDNAQLLSQTDFGNAQHWGIFLGVAAPFGLIGLAAAIRNMKGAYTTQKNLKQLIRGLNADLVALKQAGFGQDVAKLQAFKQCLKYSKYDAQFNWVVPGIINGVASSLVLSTAFVSHPFALAAIGLYATGQIIRNAGDAIKAVAHRPETIATGEPVALITGKRKVNQIQTSKFRFYVSNTLGFVTFAGGAAVTLSSVLGLSIFGLGALTLPIGLALLGTGAGSTGIINNIWPRKFKPRNGELGKAREQFNAPNDVLKEIAHLQIQKKAIQAIKSVVVPPQQFKKMRLKLLTAMPELRDFLPKSITNRITQFNSRFLPFLPVVGNQATEKKHQLNIQLAQQIHKTPNESFKAIQTRLSMLQQLPGNQNESIDGNNLKQLTTHTWRLLVKQRLHSAVIESWFQDGVLQQPVDGSCPGLNAQTADWIKFNFEEFIQGCNPAQLKELNVAIDFYLYFKFEKTARYKIYGLNDYFWAWKHQLVNLARA